AAYAAVECDSHGRDCIIGRTIISTFIWRQRALETHDLLSRIQQPLLIQGVSVRAGELVATYLPSRESMVGAFRLSREADGGRSDTGWGLPVLQCHVPLFLASRSLVDPISSFTAPC